jgi:multidrug efflux system outer membrane protein
LRAELLATGYGRRGLALSLATAVAQGYFELQELDQRLAIARGSITAFESTHAIFRRRYEAGITSRLAVTRAESALAEASGTATDIERQIAMKEHQLCVLLGRQPGAIARNPPDLDARIPVAIPAGLPSSLLDRRPDLLESEQLFAAASARIGVAKAKFLPSISLTTLLGGVSPQLSTLTNGSATIWALAATTGGPIFTAGRLKRGYRAAVAAFDQAKFRYLQQTLQAFQEVSDALVSAQTLAQREREQMKQVAALQESVAIAEKRYRGGLASYYEVLEAQQQLFPAQMGLSQTRRNRRLTVVQVYKALGGGWNLTDAQWSQAQ